LNYGCPQVDTFCCCEELRIKLKSKNLNAAAKHVATAKPVHKRRSKKFYSALKTSQEQNKNNDGLAISFDYMQNLQLPIIPAQDLFYLRQLNAFVFCVHDMKLDKLIIYLYYEGFANKGLNEVSSLLRHYNVPTNTKELNLFSDNFQGQNENHIVKSFLQALTDSGKFKTIHQFFAICFSLGTGTLELSMKVEDRQESTLL
jgi:hypothetical protein